MCCRLESGPHLLTVSRSTRSVEDTNTKGLIKSWIESLKSLVHRLRNRNICDRSVSYAQKGVESHALFLNIRLPSTGLTNRIGSPENVVHCVTSFPYDLYQSEFHKDHPFVELYFGLSKLIEAKSERQWNFSTRSRHINKPPPSRSPNDAPGPEQPTPPNPPTFLS